MRNLIHQLVVALGPQRRLGDSAWAFPAERLPPHSRGGGWAGSPEASIWECVHESPWQPFQTNCSCTSRPRNCCSEAISWSLRWGQRRLGDSAWAFPAERLPPHSRGGGWAGSPEASIWERVHESPWQPFRTNCSCTSRPRNCCSEAISWSLRWGQRRLGDSAWALPGERLPPHSRGGGWAGSPEASIWERVHESPWQPFQTNCSCTSRPRNCCSEAISWSLRWGQRRLGDSAWAFPAERLPPHSRGGGWAGLPEASIWECVHESPWQPFQTNCSCTSRPRNCCSEAISWSLRWGQRRLGDSAWAFPAERLPPHAGVDELVCLKQPFGNVFTKVLGSLSRLIVPALQGLGIAAAKRSQRCVGDAASATCFQHAVNLAPHKFLSLGVVLFRSIPL